MADETKTEQEEKSGSIDYSKSSADVQKQKDKAHDEDAKRLTEEHESQGK